MSLKVEDLLYALDNENNTGVAGLTASKIKQEKNDVLQKLQLSKEELKDFHSRLADYRYVDEVSGLQEGRYIRSQQELVSTILKKINLIYLYVEIRNDNQLS